MKPWTIKQSLASVWAAFFYAASVLVLFAATKVQADPLDSPGCAAEFADLASAQKNQRVTEVTAPILRRSLQVPLEGKVTDRDLIHSVTKTINLNLPRTTALENLADQTYLYVIDSHGRLAIMPRTVDPGPIEMLKPDARFLGSHEALSLHLGPATQLQAAGEIIVRDGRIRAVSNGSGTFRGNSANLEYGTAKLKQAGLPVDERTEYLDYAEAATDPSKKLADPHLGAAATARIEIKWRNDIKLTQLLNDTRAVMRILDSKFSTEKPFGRVAFEAMQKPADRNSIFDGVSLFGMWQQTADSEVVSLSRFLDKYGEARVRHTLKVLQNIADAN